MIGSWNGESGMKTKAAVCGGSERSWQVEELDLDDPKPGEAMVRLTASGLCHSDEHLVTGDIPMHFPVVGGHEGAGVIPQDRIGLSHLGTSLSLPSNQGDQTVVASWTASTRSAISIRALPLPRRPGTPVLHGRLLRRVPRRVRPPSFGRDRPDHTLPTHGTGGPLRSTGSPRRIEYFRPTKRYRNDRVHLLVRPAGDLHAFSSIDPHHHPRVRSHLRQSRADGGVTPQ